MGQARLLFIDDSGIVTTSVIYGVDGEEGVGLTLRKTTIFTNAQIISASNNEYLVIIPATQVLNYSGFPTVIPVILKAWAILDARSGAYTNVNSASELTIVYGSDFSLNAGRSIKINTGVTLEINGFSSAARKTWYSFMMVEERIATDGLYDNAIAFFIDNKGDGVFTGGHSSNTLSITVDYTISET